MALVLVAVGLVLPSCATDGQDGSDEGRPTVRVFGPWRDAAAEAFRGAIAPFEDDTGIDVVYTGTGSFEADIVDRLQSGAPPDIAVFPQPGLMNDLADNDLLRPLPSRTADAARERYRPELREAIGELTGAVGVLYRVNVKSLVWYRPSVFEEAGYEVPRTWAALEALSERAVADGRTPWCLGVEAFAASGWPATDWVEDVLLRHQPVEVYDAWTAGEVPFTDDRIAEAFTEFEDLVLDVDRVVGGRRGALNTAVSTAADPMFDDPPGCLMYRMASFQVDNLDPSLEIGPDGDTDVFVLPGRDDAQAPLLVGATFLAAATDRPQTRALMDYLAGPAGSAAWVEAGGFISPHADVSTADYGTAFDARVAGLLAEADLIRFDGSDLMAPQVGTGTFFESMVGFVATGRLQDALETAQSGYED